MTVDKEKQRAAINKRKLEGMTKEANNHQTQMNGLVQKLSQSDGLDSGNIQNMLLRKPSRSLPKSCRRTWEKIQILRRQ